MIFLLVDIFWIINCKFIQVDLFKMPKTAMQEGQWDKVRDRHTYKTKYTGHYDEKQIKTSEYKWKIINSFPMH